MQRVIRDFLYIMVVCLTFNAFPAFADGAPFAIDDYFDLKRITELTLSSDGELIAYVVESQSLDENQVEQSVYVSATTPGVDPILIESIQGAKNLAWIPGRHELAYLFSKDGVMHLYSINIKTKKIRRHTRGTDPVTRFQFAPVGDSLAWLTQSRQAGTSSQLPEFNRSTLYDRLFHGNEGVIVNSENFLVYDLLDPERSNYNERLVNSLWLKRTGASPSLVDSPGRVKTFYWSSDGSKLSLTYIAEDIPESVRFTSYTSLGVFDVPTQTFRTLARADAPAPPEEASLYSGGEWAVGKKALFVRRTIARSYRRVHASWTLFDLEREKQCASNKAVWHEIDPHYYEDPKPEFIPTDEDTIFSNRTVHGQRSLYKVGPNGIELADMLREVEGSTSLFQFNADFEAAAFVNEDLARPPEIFIWRKGKGVTKLTQLNREIAEKELPSFRKVIWKSEDGIAVQGWLLEPLGRQHDRVPWPLVTFVHGGPRYAAKNEFAAYFDLWPYPFELYALNGIAVFIPNYRGTSTFGQDFLFPSPIYGKPVDDIVSGVVHLMDEGIADPDRLAISGHSHGAGLGPFVMTRKRVFRAGSFAEGVLNKIMMYTLAPAWLNREIQDWDWGASLYDDPQRYIAASADLHLKGLETAVLFEAGAKSAAVMMMGSPKAAVRAGMPAEFVIYPKTGHNPTLPSIQKESATRNLDWFRFWLQGYEDPDPEKEEQYARWRKMRDKRCSREDLDTPSYCNQ